MAYYAAVVCLEQLLNQLLNSDLFPKEDVISLHGNISSLKSSLEIIFPAPKNYRNEANKLADRIRKKIFEAQDTIESFIFSTSKSQSLTSFSLQEITADIGPITKEAEKLGDSILEGRKYTRPVDESWTYRSSVSGRKTKIVGQEKYKAEIEKKLLAMTGSRLVIPITGMVGIGKTTLAKSIYEDDTFMRNFPYKAWVTVSQDANFNVILGKLLHSLESRGQKAGDKKHEGDEGKLRLELRAALSNNKYLVVIDDLWDPEIWMKLRVLLPDNENSSRVLVTSRILKVAHDSARSTDGLEMELLSDEDSWTLLRNRTFGDDMKCPANLVNIGRKIAKHCEGLPLSLTVIGGLLSQGSKETEYWQHIEQDTLGNTSNSRVEEAYIEILCLSYDNLPCNLRCCFLYMAAFPEGSNISLSKLTMLCIAEGFFTALSLPQSRPGLLEKVVEQSLLDLVDRNLVVIRRKGSDGRIKAFGMHSSLRDLAENESGRDRFLHLRKRYSQRPEDDTEFQRRVSVHKNALMCSEEVYNSTKNIEKARSFLYAGPLNHPHPMHFKVAFDLLRVFDAFTVFFTWFPNEILKLIYLRYLSFTYNGKLPSRIAKLQNLQVLIVKRQPKIIFVGTPFLPDEIWNMKELRHLIITETDLPQLSPTKPGSVLLENLQTLLNVNAATCTEEVLDNMPNLKRLKMWVEAPGKVGLYLNKLHQLQVFRLAVLKPVPGKKIEFQPKLFFPDTVRKLCLSGTGLPWEEMEAVAALPNLQVLKLKELAFHGEEWQPTYTFVKLKYLLIEYLNLRKWEANSSHFPSLEQLIIRHCYDLEELPSYIEELDNLRVIELVDCSPDAVAWAEDAKTMAEDYGIEMLQVLINSSWE